MNVLRVDGSLMEVKCGLTRRGGCIVKEVRFARQVRPTFFKHRRSGLAPEKPVTTLP